jgi:hypothetical protein
LRFEDAGRGPFFNPTGLRDCGGFKHVLPDAVPERIHKGGGEGTEDGNPFQDGTVFAVD